MLLNAPLLSKSSFIGSLFNKCRQVFPKKPSTNNNNNFSPTPAPHTHPSTVADNNNENRSTSVQQLEHGVAKLSLSRPVEAGSKTLEEQVGLPPRPKKPLTPYFRFMREMRPKLLAENPEINSVDIVRVLSKQWNSADSHLKERLQTEFKKDQQQYVERRAKYDSNVSDEQRAEIKQLKQDIQDAKERRILRKRIKELGRPKKPASAFLRFIAEERKNVPQTAKQTYREWHEKATAKWSRLKDDEKQIYMEAARLDFEKHKKDIAVWEQKMVKLGNVDVVRQASLIDIPDAKPRK